MKNYALSLFAACLLSACGPTYKDINAGTGTSAAPAMSAAQMETAPACSPLPADHNPNINLTPGWVRGAAPVGVKQLDCGDRGNPSIYCASAAACVRPMTYGTNTPTVSPLGTTVKAMKAGDVRWVLNVLRGKVRACAQNADAFGTGSLECAPVECAAVGDMPTRCILPVQMMGQNQPQSPTLVRIQAASDDIVIGSIGTTTPMN